MKGQTTDLSDVTDKEFVISELI